MVICRFGAFFGHSQLGNKSVGNAREFGVPTESAEQTEEKKGSVGRH